MTILTFDSNNEIATIRDDDGVTLTHFARDEHQALDLAHGHGLQEVDEWTPANSPTGRSENRFEITLNRQRVA